MMMMMMVKTYQTTKVLVSLLTNSITATKYNRCNGPQGNCIRSVVGPLAPAKFVKW